MNQTIDFYNRNAKRFTSSTIDVEFSEIQDAFLHLLHPHALILDFGCESGRDSKYFLQKGFRVEAIDGSKEMCTIASTYTGIYVHQMLFQDLSETNRYDAIWACSSILHLTWAELKDVFEKMPEH